MGRYLHLRYLFVPSKDATGQDRNQRKSICWGFFWFNVSEFRILQGDVFALELWAQKVIPGANRGPKLVFEPALVEVGGVM